MTGHMGWARICCANGKGAAQRTLACRPGAALRPQLTAFCTSAPIVASSAAVNSFSAKAVGHMAPSSRFALSAEAERRVPRFELLRALEEADHLAVLGIRGHPVPGSRREDWRAGLHDGMESLGHGAI